MLELSITLLLCLVDVSSPFLFDLLKDLAGVEVSGPLLLLSGLLVKTGLP